MTNRESARKIDTSPPAKNLHSKKAYFKNKLNASSREEVGEDFLN